MSLTGHSAPGLSHDRQHCFPCPSEGKETACRPVSRMCPHVALTSSSQGASGQQGTLCPQAVTQTALSPPGCATRDLCCRLSLGRLLESPVRSLGEGSCVSVCKCMYVCVHANMYIWDRISKFYSDHTKNLNNEDVLVHQPAMSDSNIFITCNTAACACEGLCILAPPLSSSSHRLTSPVRAFGV